jgi:PhnB protein
VNSSASEKSISSKESSVSEVKPIPEGYHSVHPYLIFKRSPEAIAFYVKAFGAEEKLRMQDAKGQVSHAEIQIGDCCIMMADEVPHMDAFCPEHYGGSPVSLLIYTEDCDAMFKQALAAGATILREPADQPYGDRMSGVGDPFGYKWWIATHIKDVSLEELQS